MAPIDTLIRLNSLTLELDETQAWIDHARSAAPRNRIVQSKLDRQQAELDEKRRLIEQLMFNIQIRN